MAQRAGIDITHLDSHMAALTVTNPRFFEAMLAVARDLNVPARVNFDDLRRMPTHSYLAGRVAAAGILSPDVQVRVPPLGAGGAERAWRTALEAVRAGGVSEILTHPAEPSPEMQASIDDWAERVAHTEFLGSPRFRQAIRDLGITLVGYRDLRHLQRTGTPPERRPS
jgi:hypothetical protein